MVCYRLLLSPTSNRVCPGSNIRSLSTGHGVANAEHDTLDQYRKRHSWCIARYARSVLQQVHGQDWALCSECIAG
eukprot:698340-Rhodomonas_salina.4